MKKQTKKTESQISRSINCQRQPHLNPQPIDYICLQQLCLIHPLACQRCFHKHHLNHLNYSLEHQKPQIKVKRQCNSLQKINFEQTLQQIQKIWRSFRQKVTTQLDQNQKEVEKKLQNFRQRFYREMLKQEYFEKIKSAKNQDQVQIIVQKLKKIKSQYSLESYERINLKIKTFSQNLDNILKRNIHQIEQKFLNLKKSIQNAEKKSQQIGQKVIKFEQQKVSLDHMLNNVHYNVKFDSQAKQNKDSLNQKNLQISKIQQN